MGRPSIETELVIGADLGLPVTAPVNSATILQPLSPTQWNKVLSDLRSLFSGPGGGWQVIDASATADLEREGFHPGTEPCMWRPAGGAAPPPPPGLTIVEVGSDATVADMNAVIIEGYGLPSTCEGHMFESAAFGDSRYRAWVGYVDGRPVSTATAGVAAGLVGVYVVATVPEARGRGYGEALTWSAVASAPELDATLQASDMGKPIYERMGFETIATLTVWTTERQAR